MKTVFLLISSIFSILLFGQERVLLRIGENGRQEAIPLRPGENIKGKLDELSAQSSYVQISTGLNDTLKYFQNVSLLNARFGFNDYDVAFQWYMPSADGVVRELWWNNSSYHINYGKWKIKAWNANSRLLNLPPDVVDGTGRMGYYINKNDHLGGGITPFKDEATDTVYRRGIGSDSAKAWFDPLGTEAMWKKGGTELLIDVESWQKLDLLATGDTMNVKNGKIFGFTLMNSIFEQGTFRQELLSKKSEGFPYHSLKFYNMSSTPGWQIRSYEWGMFVVVEYTGDRAPSISLHYAPSLIVTSSSTFSFLITDDNPGGGSSGVAGVQFFSKKGAMTSIYDSMSVNLDGQYYKVKIPELTIDDTLYWYVAATDVNGNRRTTTVRKTGRHISNKTRLIIHNERDQFIGVVFPHQPAPYDIWSTNEYGIAELDYLFTLYQNIHVVDGHFPSHNIYPSIAKWLASGTSQSKRNLFFNSQDYGCYISSFFCRDTTFSSGSWEYEFLGITKLGPQDLPHPNKETRLIPLSDNVTNYLVNFEKDSNATLWYYPIFELGFEGSPDAIGLRPSTVPLFTSGTGSYCVGTIHRGSTFNALFLSFDEGGLQFRSDTSLSPSSDPKYLWIADAKLLSTSFFETVKSQSDHQAGVIKNFSLSQNYPNPFNPVTTIDYTVAVPSHVSIKLYNAIGQQMGVVVDEEKTSGEYSVQWNASSLSSGLYFCEMRAGDFSSVIKLVLLK